MVTPESNQAFDREFEGQTPTEKESPNTFVNFIRENQEDFDLFTTRTREIKHLERSVQESLEVDELVDDGLPLFSSRRKSLEKLPPGQSDIYPDSPEAKEVRKLIISTILEKRGVKEENLGEPKTDFERMRHPWMVRVNDAAFAHEERVRPLEEDLNKAGADLNQKFFSYLMTSADNLYNFSIFLSDEEYRSEREDVRPFLVSLASQEMNSKRDNHGKTTSLIDQAVEEWVANLDKNPDEESLSNFIEDKLNFGSSKQNVFDLGSHLKFGREMVERRYPDLQLRSLGEMSAKEIVGEDLPEYANWPEQLKKEFNIYLKQEFSPIVVKTKENLREFRRIETKNSGEIGGSGFPDRLPHYKARHESSQTQVFPESKKATETISHEKRLAVFTEGESPRKGTTELVSDEERKERLMNQVEEKYKNNEAIVDGLEKVLGELLQEDPKKLGASRTAPMQIINLDGHPFAIWNMVPKIKSQISLPVSFPRDAHILFAIDSSKSDGSNLVFIGMGDELWYKKFLGLRSLKNTKYRRKH